jgi:hypothetical protein
VIHSPAQWTAQPPDFVKQLISADNFPTSPHEIPQQVKFPGRELQELPAPRRVLPPEIQLNVAEAEILHLGVLGRGAPHLDAHASQQFPNAERLCDIIVSPDFQPDSYQTWTADVTAHEHVGYINLTQRIAAKYDALGPEKVEPLFGDEPPTPPAPAPKSTPTPS